VLDSGYSLENNRLRIGILGAAIIAERSIIPAILGLPGQYELAGVASRSDARAVMFSEKFRVRTYRDYASLVLDPNIDCIYIPLPNSLHFPWAKLSLLNQKHIIVEKPLCSTVNETEELITLARGRGLALFENFQYRFHRRMKSLRALVSQNIIGELRGIYSTFAFPPINDVSNIRYQKDLGGGALMDAGCYPLSISYDFFGENLNVIKSKLFYEDEFQVDIGGIGYLEERLTGRFAIINFGFSDPYECSLELVGSRGRVHCPRIFTAPPDLKTTINVRLLNNGYSLEEEPDNQSVRMLEYFYFLTLNSRSKRLEYERCLALANLREQIKNPS